MDQDFRVNDIVMTPNGKGILQGRMYENGQLFVIVRHVVKEMTHVTTENTLTKYAAIGDPRYPTGLWVYEIGEISHAG